MKTSVVTIEYCRPDGALKIFLYRFLRSASFVYPLRDIFHQFFMQVHVLPLKWCAIFSLCRISGDLWFSQPVDKLGKVDVVLFRSCFSNSHLSTVVCSQSLDTLYIVRWVYTDQAALTASGSSLY